MVSRARGERAQMEGENALNDDLCGLLDGLSSYATHDCGCVVSKERFVDDREESSPFHFVCGLRDLSAAHGPTSRVGTKWEMFKYYLHASSTSNVQIYFAYFSQASCSCSFFLAFSIPNKFVIDALCFFASAV